MRSKQSNDGGWFLCGWAAMNGAGHIEAVFPVNGTYSSARVTVKASIGPEGKVNLTELKCKYCLFCWNE